MKKTTRIKPIAFAITICLIVQTAAMGSFVFADWTSLGGENSGHTDGLTPRAAAEISVEWTKAFDKTALWNSVGYPILVGDYLYVAVAGSIYKIDKHTSKISAENVLGRPAASSAAEPDPATIGYASFMAYGDGKIYVPLQGGDIQAFDAATLEPVWYADYDRNTAHKKVLVRVQGVPGSTVMDAAQAAADYPNVTIGAGGWTDGARLSSIEYKAETQVLYQDGRIYTGVYYYHNNNETHGTFFAVRTGDDDPGNAYEDKDFLWEYEESAGNLRGYYWAGVADAGDAVIVAGDAGTVLSLNKSDGVPTDSTSIVSGDESFARAGMTYVPDGSGTGDLYLSTKAGTLWKLSYNETSKSFGPSKKSAALSGGPGASAPALSGNKLYTFSGQINGGGKLDVFDKNTLAKKATVDFGGYSQSFPLVSDAYNGKTYLYAMLNEPGQDTVVVFEDSLDSAAPKSRTLYKPGGSQSLNSIIADDDGTLYFFDGAGKLNALSSKYLDSDPMELQGWHKQADGTWKYYADGGVLTGWKKYGGAWYYLDNKNGGAMATGWLKDDGAWYYFARDGVMKTGWLRDNAKWYYLGSASDGAMKTGSYKINGKNYVFNKSGVWIR
ncbi:MAG: hypothetical protein LBL36_07325 [Clostridiales Family XIII bacterium]|jgi:hypothetical protein|nr:hypothetical protein [Clostridiales Family XIII bacterium]